MSKVKILDAPPSDYEDLFEPSKARKETRELPSIEELGQRAEQLLPSQKRQNFERSLEEAGAGKQKVARTIAEILECGDDRTRLNAAQLAMRAMGILDPVGASQTGVQILIQGDNVNVKSILQPN